MKLKLAINILFLLLLFILSLANAKVDLQTGNFSKEFIDINFYPNSNPLDFVRTYNSLKASNNNSIFGIGWCSNIEFSLKIRKKIISTIQCNQVKNEFIKIKSNLFFSKTNQEYIEYKNQNYIYQDKNNLTRTFDNKGRLIKLNDIFSNFVEIFYNEKSLPVIFKTKKDNFSISYNPNYKIKQIKKNEDTIMLYSYHSQLLMIVSNKLKGKYKYSYQHNHKQLNQINYPDKTIERISFYPQSLLVKNYKQKNNCQETFTYKNNNKRIKKYQKTLFTIKCPNVAVIKGINEYKFNDKQPDKIMELKKQIARKILYIKYNNQGQPIYVQKDKNYVKANYQKDGKIKSIRSPANNINFKYTKNLYRKLNSLELNNRVYAQYSYNKDNLVNYIKTNGYEIKISYNSKNLPSTITDSNKERLNIRYNNLNQVKYMSLIGKAGSGAIHYNYNSQNELEDIKFNSSNAAKQIIEKYEKWKKLIEPAIKEISIFDYIS